MMSGMASAPPTETLTGRIAVQIVARGSKSERLATVLILDDHPDAPPVVLRRADFAGLGVDPGLDAWIGQRVTVEGRRAFSTFQVTSITAAPPPG
jgi:hypothetical protein